MGVREFFGSMRFSTDDTLGVTQSDQINDERMAGLLKCFKADGSFIPPSEEPAGGRYTKEELKKALEIRRQEAKKRAEAENYAVVDQVEQEVHGPWESILGEKKIINTPEDGFGVLAAYDLIVSEISYLVERNEWSKVAYLALLFKKENMSDRLPLDVKKFSDHDTRHLRIDINSILDSLNSVSGKLVSEEERVEEMERLTQNLREDWELYEFVMSDILMRIENRERVPERFANQDFSLSEVLEPVTAHMSKIAHNYYYEEDGKRINKSIILEVDKDLERKNVNGNKNTLGNVLNNVVVNALGFASKSVIVKLEQLGEKIVVGVYNDGEAVMEERNDANDEQRPGQLKIYNPGFSTRFSEGLGLSYADTRLESFGSEIEIMNNKKIDGKMYNGFEISLSISEK